VARLRRLGLGFQRVGDVGLRALATSSHLTSLTELSVPCTDIGPEGLQALTWSTRLMGHLTYLDLDGNQVGDAGARSWLRPRTSQSAHPLPARQRNRRRGRRGAGRLANLRSLRKLRLTARGVRRNGWARRSRGACGRGGGAASWFEARRHCLTFPVFYLVCS